MLGRSDGTPLVRDNARGADSHSRCTIFAFNSISKIIGYSGNWKKQDGLPTDDEYNLLVWPGHSSFSAIEKRRIVPCKVDDTQTAHRLVDCTLDRRHATEQAALADLYARRAFGLPMADR